MNTGAKVASMPHHPYQGRPERAFWRKAVAAGHVTELSGLFDGVPDLDKYQVATGGSCFAQHIGKALRQRGLSYLDYEPAPPFLSTAESQRHGYGIYSCRYGNIYTTRQLWQLFQEAFGKRSPKDDVWARDDRYFDALRPGIEPDGFDSAEEVRSLRQTHLAKVRDLFRDLDIFVFTLGLTEAWVSNVDETVYPIAPGVIAGTYDPGQYYFHNFRYPEIYEDLRQFIEGLRAVNPKAQLLLTVSPVPLAATATENHVLVATTYSKSVLRSVAGDIAVDFEGVHYFPSYEVITGQPSRHMHYNPDLRTVCQAGVNEVMRHFFVDSPDKRDQHTAGPTPSAAVAPAPTSEEGFEQCEEALLDAGAP